MEQPYKELKWTAPPLDISAAAAVSESNADNAASTDESRDGSNAEAEEEERSNRTTQPLNAETTALLVVDVQPEYWSKASSVRKDFPEFPDNIRRTIDICRKRQAKIIFIRADYRYSDSPWLTQFARLRGESPDTMIELPCDPSSDEFAWEEFAKPEGGEVIIPKTSWSSVSNTALLEHLRGSGIDTVLVCGLITSVCVHHSAFGIFEAGYRTVLVADACADRGRQRHDAALALYGDYMYEIMQTTDLENPKTGLVKAEPVWLTLDSKHNVVSMHHPRSVQSSIETYEMLNDDDYGTAEHDCNRRKAPPTKPPMSSIGPFTTKLQEAVSINNNKPSNRGKSPRSDDGTYSMSRSSSSISLCSV